MSSTIGRYDLRVNAYYVRGGCCHIECFYMDSVRRVDAGDSRILYDFAGVVRPQDQSQRTRPEVPAVNHCGGGHRLHDLGHNYDTGNLRIA